MRAAGYKNIRAKPKNEQEALKNKKKIGGACEFHNDKLFVITYL